MDATTGLHMLYGDMMGGGRMMISPTAILGWIVCKAVLGFLWVWLCVWLIHRWHLTPCGKGSTKRGR